MYTEEVEEQLRKVESAINSLGIDGRDSLVEIIRYVKSLKEDMKKLPLRTLNSIENTKKQYSKP